jgi:hypothetical protein
VPGVAIVNQPSVTPRTDAGVEIDFATEAKLEAVRLLLVALDAKDFSTEVTLDNFLTAFNGEDFASQATLQALLTAFNNEDFASEVTLAALKTAFDAEDFASETTLASIKDTDGIKKITDALPVGANVIGKTITRSGAKGTSVGADITSTPYDANTEALHIDVIDTNASRLFAKLVIATYHLPALVGSKDVVMIDLSDAGGDYKHVGSSSVKPLQISASIVKSTIGAKWRSKIGIILVIDGTAATIFWSDAATLYALDTSAVEQHKAAVFPSPIDFEVSGGALVDFAGGFIETGVTEYNTGATLDNVVGNPTTPAVGDMVLRIINESGGGDAEVAYGVRYLVD